MRTGSRFPIWLRLILVLGFCTHGVLAVWADEAAMVPEIRPGVLAGYLPASATVDSAALLPPPPAEGSAALALDQDISRTDLALQGTPLKQQPLQAP